MVYLSVVLLRAFTLFRPSGTGDAMIRMIVSSLSVAVLVACDYSQVGDGRAVVDCGGDEGAGDARRDWFGQPTMVTGHLQPSNFVDREVVVHLLEDQGGAATLVLYADSDFSLDCWGYLDILGDRQNLFGRNGEYVDVVGAYYEGEFDGLRASVSGDELHLSK